MECCSTDAVAIQQRDSSWSEFVFTEEHGVTQYPEYGMDESMYDHASTVFF